MFSPLIDIEVQENKVKQELKIAAKRPNSQKALKTLALELVHSRHAKNRLLTGKTQLNSVTMQLKEQIAMIKLSGCLEKSTQIMSSMNTLLKLPQISLTMQELSKEMIKVAF